MNQILVASSILEVVAAVAVLAALLRVTRGAGGRTARLLLATTVAGILAGAGDLLTVSGFGGLDERILSALTAVSFAAFGLLLYAFSREYGHRSPRLDIALASFTGVILVAALLPPERIALKEHMTPATIAFSAAQAGQFLACALIAGVRLWRDGRSSRSPILRRRMCGLALGVFGLCAAFAISVSSDALPVESAARLAASLSAVVLVVAYLQPRPLRVLALSRESSWIESVLSMLMTATDAAVVTGTMLPTMADLVGADRVELYRGGTMIAFFPADSEAEGGLPVLAQDRPACDEVRAGGLSVCVPDGEFVARASRFAPLFGTEELRVVKLFAACTMLALARCDEIAQERRSARELAETKNTFIAAASHDLRTPLAVIRGGALTLRDMQMGLSPDERELMLDAIVNGANRLDQLLVDLLEITMIERGGVSLDRHSVDLLDLVSRVVDRTRADTSNVTVSGVHAMAAVDAGKIERVVENLLTNAEKYTPRGSHIDVAVAPNDDAGSATIVVEDDGPGLPESFRGRAFSLFERADPRGTIQGSGVGLTIVSVFTEAHGGHVTLGDSPSGGARFEIHLPRHS